MTHDQSLVEQMRPIDPHLMRAVCGQFVTGVAVVTTRTTSHTPLGLTINSFTSASLDPPLVLFCLRRESGVLPVLRDSGIFAVNILAEHQELLSRGFARRGARLEGLQIRRQTTGAPVLSDALAYLDCRLVGEHTAGDHAVILGHVVDLDVLQHDGRPLTVFRSRHHALAGQS
jgi:3-hydroxy-9,10-secoandrosta-1,3,5(10)-triene-9,17-dione monooxygenase reductase component